MAGMDSKPSKTTEAPTMPVEAAKRIPINVTVIPKPPRTRPKSSCIANIMRCATPDLSSIKPIKINIGKATSTQFSIKENIRETTKPKTFRSRPVNVSKCISDR